MADPSQPSSVSPLDPTANSPLSYSAVTDPRLSGQFGVASSFDEQLRMAMELSCREQEEMDRQQKEEEEELERILQLSLTEKLLQQSVKDQNIRSVSETQAGGGNRYS
ncbi:ankyrin repeat domain-containing protein 13B [Micropterus dolomieu]|uniref:ankyrin repeat domain-containing protein 13B n=1 Tax=Micropterus dolomieu TaxID=147949 RepID=UPI001E8DE54D|nr:ankyrin repeat domain-containing protein 13B [Micropterus dolomieu]